MKLRKNAAGPTPSKKILAINNQTDWIGLPTGVTCMRFCAGMQSHEKQKETVLTVSLYCFVVGRKVCDYSTLFSHKRILFNYFAYATLRISRITVTFTCPGYCMSRSIFCEISKLSCPARSSDAFSASTITRNSRPACIA
jgi:hypothetical protein